MKLKSLMRKKESLKSWQEKKVIRSKLLMDK
jgi:hypothetical protein